MSNNGSGWPIPTMEEVKAMVKLQKLREEARRRDYLMAEKEHQLQYEAWLLSEKVRLRRAKAMERRQKIARAVARAKEEEEARARWERKQARLAKLAANPPPPPASQEALRRSRMDWVEYLGNEMVAARQVAWERNATALAMREAGLTFKAIGHKFGVCGSRAQQFTVRGMRDRKSGRRSPAEEYMAVPLLLIEPPKPAPIKPVKNDLWTIGGDDWLKMAGSGG